MRFRCERDVLKQALQVAARAVRNQSAPSLTGLRLELTGDRLSVRGSDVELTIDTELDVGGDSDGVVLLKAKLLADIVAAMDPGAVTVALEGDVAMVSAGRSRFELHPLPLEGFPVLEPASGMDLVLEASSIETALRQVLRAASTDEAHRQILTGVLFTSHGDGLRLVTTDSYRLAVSDVSGAAAVGGDDGIVVPKRALDELVRVLTDQDKIKVTLGERDATFVVGPTSITTRLLEGSFPNYQALIPSGYPNSLHVNVSVMADAIRRVKLLVKNTATPVKLAFGTDGVQLSVDGFEEGTASEAVESSYQGEELVIGFNPDYLLSGLEGVPGEEAVLETVDAAKVAVIRAPDDENFLYLLMPHRIG